MKKQFFSITMTALIALSAGVRGSEIGPENQVATADLAVAAPITVSVIAPVAVAAVDTNKKAPLLVPFDQGLYKLLCQSRQSVSKASSYGNIVTMTLGATMLAIGMYTLYDMGPEKVMTISQGLWTKFYKAKLLDKLYDLAFVYSAKVSPVLMIGSALYATKSFGKNIKSLILWEDREDLRVLEQRDLWHQEIFAQFGKPEVVGTLPLSGKYILKGTKKYGAGQVIFDPFDSAQVKILLGAHGSITEDLRCSKIEIIVVEEVKTDK